MSVGSSFLGFSMGRREDKTHLQKLHQEDTPDVCRRFGTYLKMILIISGPR